METIVDKLNRIELLISMQVNANKPMTTAEAGIYMGVAEETVRRKLQGGEISHYKQGGRYYILRADIDKYLLQNRILGNVEIEEQAQKIADKIAKSINRNKSRKG